MNSVAAVQSRQAFGKSQPWFEDARWLTAAGTYISRYSLVLILFWIGISKFTLAEAEAIQPLIMNSPFTSWMYSFLSVGAVSSMIGAVELTLALLIALRPISPKASLVGSLGAVGTFLTTISFLFTTPGVIDHTHAVPLLAALGGFLIKDVALLGCAVWTAAEAQSAYSAR
jgi:reactive chlorine resistance protein C